MGSLPSCVGCNVTRCLKTLNQVDELGGAMEVPQNSNATARVVPLSFTPENGSLVAGKAIQMLKFVGKMVGKCGSTRSWKEVEACFDKLAVVSPENGWVPAISRSDFPECIGMKESREFGDQLLQALTRRRGSQKVISKQELHYYWSTITDPSFKSRISIFFDLCDKDMDGKISETEIKEVILLSASTNKLEILEEDAEDYASIIMEELDHENLGHIGLSQLEEFFKELFSSESYEHGYIPKWIYTNPIQRIISHFTIEIQTHWRRAWIILAWLLACASLFAWKFMQYKQSLPFEVMGYCLCTAKGAAETLKLNMALILLPVCRNTITWLRQNRWISSVIPFNDNINFHKLIAGGIVTGVILHGGTHLACDFPRIVGCNHTIFRQTIYENFGHHQPSYVEILATTEVATGICMVAMMVAAFLTATQLPRRNPAALPWPFRRITGFNVFWYSHHLFILVYALLIVHSMLLFFTKDNMEKTTWMYIAIPIIIYVGERIIRINRSNHYDCNVLEAVIYPGKVLSLKLRKPKGFHYRSGMYVFLQCPQISPFEWHPFSLTSAPDDPYLALHIRTLGDWTHQIYSVFQETSKSSTVKYPRLLIDGPYGSASQDHINYDIVLLVGLGIGATPFISVLHHIVHALRRPSPDIIDGGESGSSSHPSKVYFYWVTREQGSFDWFRDIMNEISNTNKKQGQIEMHNYLTSVYEEGDARSALISMIQALHHAKTGIDVVSHTPVRAHFARPNWHRVYCKLAERHAGAKIGVFCCGPQILAKELERLSKKFTNTTSTRFVFHKENY